MNLIALASPIVRELSDRLDDFHRSNTIVCNEYFLDCSLSLRELDKFLDCCVCDCDCTISIANDGEHLRTGGERSALLLRFVNLAHPSYV